MRAMFWDNRLVRFAAQILAAFCFSSTAFGQATGQSLSPANVFASAPTLVHLIFELSLFVLSIVAAIFLWVFALLAYSAVKFRGEEVGRERSQIYERDELGLAWTLIPILIVLALFWQQGE
jgi:heme/copper-type cytochrome/quinol oxidase subunit 2